MALKASNFTALELCRIVMFQFQARYKQFLLQVKVERFQESLDVTVETHL